MHQNKFSDTVGLAKNSATTQVRVSMDFDTSTWSRRMQNIVCNAIDTGVADCGWETGWWVKHFLEHHGLGTAQLWGWHSDLPLEVIKPNKVDEAVSYVAAMIKVKDYKLLDYNERNWIERLTEKGVSKLTRKEYDALGWQQRNNEGVLDIPVPNFNKADRQVFIREYLKPMDEQQQIKRAELINLIRSGSLLSISYIINN
jgi:hypothetical protein